MEGDEIIRSVRALSSIPIIVISARSAEDERPAHLIWALTTISPNPSGLRNFWPGYALLSGTATG